MDTSSVQADPQTRVPLLCLWILSPGYHQKKSHRSLDRPLLSRIFPVHEMGPFMTSLPSPVSLAKWLQGSQGGGQQGRSLKGFGSSWTPFPGLAQFSALTQGLHVQNCSGVPSKEPWVWRVQVWALVARAAGPGRDVLTAEGIRPPIQLPGPQLPSAWKVRREGSGEDGERGGTTSLANYIQTTGNLLPPLRESFLFARGGACGSVL